MMDMRERLTEIFEDTQAFYTQDPALAKAVRHGREAVRFYPADAELPMPAARGEGRVEVTRSRTFEAAVRLHRESPDARIAVLNFASATNPGGGVRFGSSAQEESLCRCSTLYPTLDQRKLWDLFYLPNREAKDTLHTDAVIYSPGVVICKTDEAFPQRLPASQFVTVDVITCAAPNLRTDHTNRFNPGDGAAASITREALYGLHVRRAGQIFRAAAVNGADCLVLGAFGCGAFRNDPAVVAEAYAAALETYRRCFDRIEFAVFCRDRETENYDAFRSRCR